MSVAKVTLRFDVMPEEKERLEKVCKAYGITKIDFLRTAISFTENEIKETLSRVVRTYNHEQELPDPDNKRFMKHFNDKQLGRGNKNENK